MWGEHIPVLAGPAVEWLRIRESGTYVDDTVGLGGHSRLIAQRLTTGRLIALDRDPEAVREARRRLADFPSVTVIHRNYAELGQVLQELDVGFVDGVLLDAGFSSAQLDSASRGFSFQEEGPLDMRLDITQPMTAADYLARVSAEELARVLKTCGDVRPARRIAESIIKRRRIKALHTTKDLAEAVAEALPFVTRTPEETRTVFQAIRIAVNDELRFLEIGLEQAIASLAPEGRLVVIGFHSGEDRIIKNVLKGYSSRHNVLYPDGRLKEVVPPTIKLLTPKPIRPDAEETRLNPRAHSAKLRAAEKLPKGCSSR